MSGGDPSEREIITDSRPGVNQDQTRDKKRRTENMALRRQNKREKGASEMPGVPIKVEIGGFANVNPTLRRRRVGEKKQRAEQASMNGAS
jgi:hypothetical protein